ncbi:MAG: FecCD family ABC transporter permease [Lachnospiraceae bacterium]
MERKKYKGILEFGLLVLPFLTAVLCIGIGRYQLSPLESIRILFSPLTGRTVDATAWTVVFVVRLPRVILALLAGAGLAVAGASFQSLFSNPLATPDTLGVATGASFGAVLALLFSQNILLIQLSALLMGLVALLGTCLISRVSDRGNIMMTVLGGIVMSSLFKALVSLVKYLADPEEDLPTITYWLMGSLSRATYKAIIIGVPLIVLGILVLFLLRWRLNVLSLPEDEAKALGIQVKTLRFLVMVSATMVTAACVSLCGQIEWIGLVIPHMARMFRGSDNRQVIPASMTLGATFLILMDTLARSATAAEIPVSILTALIGAPFFIILLRKQGGMKL